jgi:hypothetical protein
MEKRESFKHGSSKVEDYFGWIDERHRIYLKRCAGEPRPWTDDPILQQFKFTNVFRELDTGTIALRLMEEGQTDPRLIFLNTLWYRIFNWHEHAYDLGFVHEFKDLDRYIKERYRAGGRLFTGAHMVRGTDGGRPKHFGYLELIERVWNGPIPDMVAGMGPLIQGWFRDIINIPYIGDFTAYEIASDLRWSLDTPSDVLTWGNPGNGARRGLKRLGLAPTVDSMRELLKYAHKYTDLVHNGWPPFEMREIEHCLCEFDKYERCRQGQGRPRSKYNGTGVEV